MPIRLMRACLSIVLAMLLMPLATAAPVITGDAQSGFAIKAEDYEATVGPDGYLNHLKVGGQEFLLPDLEVSRGTYFFQAGVVRMTKTAANGDAIESESEQAHVRYAFGDRTLTWTVTNRSAKAMLFFAILPSTVTAASDGKSPALATPVNRNWPESVWMSGAAKLTIRGTGAVRQWAWKQRSTVWEAKLTAGETRVIELATGKSEDVAAPSPTTNAFAVAALSITSPLELQVFQRARRAEGSVRVAGKVAGGCDKVQVRFIGKDLDGKALGGEWQDVACDAKNGAFAANFTVAAGGWHSAEFRATRDGKDVTTAKVSRFGVGEIFVGAGQSNSTNCGGAKSSLATDGRTETKSGMVSSFDGKVWRVANDPQLGTHDTSQNGSFWPSFGDAMNARYRVPIGVAVTGHGGTSVNQWKAGGELFNWTLGRVRQLESAAAQGQAGFRAVLWHQGENDAKANMSAKAYAESLGAIIHAMRTQAGRDVPWFVAKASYRPGQPLASPVTEGQKSLWDTRVALQGPDTDALLGDLRDKDGKGIHFSKKGLKAHGEAWADKVGPWLEQQLSK